jgi:Rieske Fe-S protein
MQRRTFLEWTIHGLGAVLAAVIGVPAVAFLTDARNRPARQTGMRPVARLSELEVGVPKEIVIREFRQDAWNLHPDDVIGRIWLVREDQASVKAFTTICPHLGCSIDYSGSDFQCPCHGGKFDINGKRVTPSAGSNPAPRNMDQLPLEKVPLAGQQDFEILVEYKRYKTSLGQSVEDI